MAFFDSMKETLTTAGKDVSQKAKEVSAVTKLKLEIRSKQESLDKAYIALGKRCYELHQEGNSIEPTQEEITEISTLTEEIANLNEEILKLQGSCACPQCGAILPDNTAFCNKCGAKIETTEVE